MKAAVIGGTGYGAIELIRFLHNHPHVELETVISNSQSGNELSSVYPHVTNISDFTMESLDIDEISKKIDLVFFATPSGVSKELVPPFYENGVKCIDLSGDLRLKDPDDYENWYKKSPAEARYIDQAVYGLSEMYASEVKDASIIANPGCYPTATLLGLIPLVKSNLIDGNSIIIDAKSGVSGAGRGLSLNTHFAEINENIKAYKLGAHQHIPEIEQILTLENGDNLTVTFSTHLVPMTRGIMCTMYADLKDSQTTKSVTEIFESFYKEHPFVRVRPVGVLPTTKDVYGSNFCDIGLNVDKRTNKVTVVSVIDNLVKGASGQAIQNMNIMYGWDIRTGLMNVPVYP